MNIEKSNDLFTCSFSDWGDEHIVLLFRKDCVFFGKIQTESEVQSARKQKVEVRYLFCAIQISFKIECPPFSKRLRSCPRAPTSSLLKIRFRHDQRTKCALFLKHMFCTFLEDSSAPETS